MRGVPHEQRATMAKRAHAPALKGVHTGPFDFEFSLVPEHRAQSRHDLLGLLFLLGIGIGTELKIDAPDIVGLPVQQRRLMAVKRRIEPEPPFSRKIRVHQDVGDQKAVAERLPLAFKSEHAPDRAARAVGDDQPIGKDGVFPRGRGDADGDMIGARRHADHLVLPAKLGLRQA